MNNAIVVPVYKKDLLPDERQSLLQCGKILSRHAIFLACPDNLDTTEYDRILDKQLDKKTFCPDYFTGIGGYNQLMKSHAFYNSFREFDYILIYQLDAWVFYDALDEWCSKGYDYVGAPWFEEYKDYEHGYPLWHVGNGGFSLRRTRKFLDITRDRDVKLKTVHEIFRDEYHGIGDLGRCLIRCLGPYIGNNCLRHFMEHTHETLWEDSFFCVGLENTRFRLNLPQPEEAAFFAFEQSPRHLYEAVTHGTLPFGCHAWKKYQYEDFWMQFFQSSDTQHPVP